VYRLPIATHNRIQYGEIPVVYCVIETHMGSRVYAEKEVTATISGALEASARVLSFGSFERTLQPKKDDVLAAYEGKQIQHISLTLDNADRYFSRLMAKEPFLGRTITVKVGFEDEAETNHISLFKGVITEVFPLPELIIEADERSGTGTLYLSDTYYLPRTSRYANPLNGNDRLPIVYGDLTDGTEGVWQIPCIDTANHIYAYAGHPVLSAAGGNTVSVYVDGVLQSSGYTFSESNNVESLGNIATITFTADQGNSIVTVRGKGKVTTGTTLMENIIDIVYDFLTVENSFTSGLFEPTYKARASQIFTAGSYKAAGVITDDATYWDIVIQMMSSFLGSAYLNGAGELVLEIDDGTIVQSPTDVIPRGEINLIDAAMRLENVINQCPMNYSYSYVVQEFRRQTNDSAHADLASQGIYGVREPNTPYQCYWCRDLTTVQAVQDIIVGKFKRPVYEIEIEDITLKRIHMDIGDTVACTIDSLYDETGSPLYNQYWKLISVSPDFDGNSIRFRALQTPYYMLSGGSRDATHY
jgi:hypothetical protein